MSNEPIFFLAEQTPEEAWIACDDQPLLRHREAAPGEGLLGHDRQGGDRAVGVGRQRGPAGKVF